MFKDRPLNEEKKDFIKKCKLSIREIYIHIMSSFIANGYEGTATVSNYICNKTAKIVNEEVEKRCNEK